MFPLALMHALLGVVHHLLHTHQYHAVCHFHRSHFISPLPGHKWVTVAHVRCRILAPAYWYRSP